MTWRVRLFAAALVLTTALATDSAAQAGAPAKASPPASAESREAATMAGPAVGWVLPVFSDKEGYRLLTLRGSAARRRSAAEIAVTGFTAIVFSGDATERVDTILMSPEATFFPKENRAAGPSDVRLILSGRADRQDDDVEVTGRGWTYEHATKKVSIAHDARVTFHAQLNDILK